MSYVKPAANMVSSVEPNELRVLEFYSGIGGMHYSLRAACIPSTVVAAFDINEVANDVYEFNFGFRPNQGNLERLTVLQLDTWKADLWLMSPPCQPYTRQGLKKDADDGRAASFLCMLEKLPKMNHPPHYIFVENVVGFETSVTHRHLVEVLQEAGYVFQEFVLTPLQFGIPYSRPRYFALAKRLPLAFAIPDLNSQLSNFPPPLTLRGQSANGYSFCQASGSCGPFPKMRADSEADAIENRHVSRMSAEECAEVATAHEEQALATCRPLADFLQAFPRKEGVATLTSLRDSIPQLTRSNSTQRNEGHGDVVVESVPIRVESGRQSLRCCDEIGRTAEQTCNLDERVGDGLSDETGVSKSEETIRDDDDDDDDGDGDGDDSGRFKQSLAASAGRGGIPLEWHTFAVPACVIIRWGEALDIVTPDSTRCCCFTKSYVRYAKGTGSVLATTVTSVKNNNGVLSKALKCKGLEEDGAAVTLWNGAPICSLGLRYFTPREVANLHSFPADFTFPSHVVLKQRYALLGNSLSVAVVAHLLRYLVSLPAV